MATSVVSSLDLSLPESMMMAQRHAPYLQCATKKTGLFTCTAAEKANGKKALWRSSKLIREPK